MPLLGVIGGGDYKDDLRDAEKKNAAGFIAYNIKVGVDAPEKDAARTREICRLLGEGMLISADANQGEVGGCHGLLEEMLDDIRRHHERKSARRQPEGDQVGWDHRACLLSLPLGKMDIVAIHRWRCGTPPSRRRWDRAVRPRHV
jgi:hypothetical protein